MKITGYKNLRDAVNSLNPIKKGEVWLVLSINGKRYYPFKSKKSLSQHILTQANMLALVNMQIENKSFNRDERMLRAENLIPFFNESTKKNELTIENGHAEEMMIKYWPQCVTDYVEQVGGKLRSVEVFLSHSPCSDYDRSPSQSRNLGGSIVYPTSCSSKLKLFFSKGYYEGVNKGSINFSKIKWKVYYRFKFTALSARGEKAFQEHFSGISIKDMSTGVGSFFDNSIERAAKGKRVDDQKNNPALHALRSSQSRAF